MGGGLSKHHDDVDVVTEAQTMTPSGIERKNSVEGKESTETKSSSKCPMHQSDGSYRYTWTQLFRAASVHGPNGSKPLSKAEQERTLQNDDCIDNDIVGAATAGCPVKHETNSACPVSYSNKNDSNDNRFSSATYSEYDVYSQPIDKTNQMPKGIKTQLPNAYQNKELSTDRVSSSIPKGGGDDDGEGKVTTWTYPSPQQFYNALTRKGKMKSRDEDDATEEDMASVVALHNNMNEKTWAKVVEWEKQTYGQSSTPKLLKFMGRPHDLSPKARLKHYLLGHPLPYDRHDWTVLRDDGTTVRYVIDYYYDESRAQETKSSSMPDLHDTDATPSLLVDVRPALDGPNQFLARTVQMPYKVWTQQTNFAPLPLKGTAEMAQQVHESIQVWKSIQESRKQQQKQQFEEELSEIADKTNEATTMSDSQAKKIALSFAKAIDDCRKERQRIENCTSEQEYSRASMDLTICMGKTICPVQHSALLNVLTSDDDGKIEGALETLTECVMLKTAERRMVREHYPNIFQL